jgi:hypothetical protein
MIEALGDLKHRIRNDIEVLMGVELEIRSLINAPRHQEAVLICADRVVKFRERLLSRLHEVEILIDKTEE